MFLRLTKVNETQGSFLYSYDFSLKYQGTVSPTTNTISQVRDN